MRIRNVLVAASLLGACALTSLPALADQGSFSDPTNDNKVTAADGTQSNSVDGATDIAAIGLTYDPSGIGAEVSLRDYNRDRIDSYTFEFSVDGTGTADLTVYAFENPEDVQVDAESGADCNVTTNGTASGRRVALDRSCLGDAAQVYVRVFVSENSNDDGSSSSDSAPSDMISYYGPVRASSSEPTATASPSATASPTPAHDVPTLVVAPFVVKYGQTANVTIEGAPGALVDLYIRKYGGAFIKIRDGLVLDSTGRITVATKPDMNLRFQAFDRTIAQGSSIGGTDGLMTVEKYISINVQKVATGRYTFTGSINPTHPGATVSLFRNGSLLKSGLPVNSSRVYSFTTNIAPGTYNFQVRTGTTGYNNASGSPFRSLSVPATTTSTSSQPASSGPPAKPADKDCSDFRTQAEAQSFFNKYYPYYGDFSDLDGDGNGRACERLP